MSQPLYSIDGQTGEVITSTCAGCNEHMAVNATLERDLKIAEKEIRSLRRNLEASRASKKEREKRARQEYKERARVEHLFQRWVQILGKGDCKLGDKRFDCLRAMIGLGYTNEQFEMAFFGAKQHAYRNPKTGQVHNDIEFICRNEANFERFANLGAAGVRAAKEDLERGAQDA
jgi:hypothetical protein